MRVLVSTKFSEFASKVCMLTTEQILIPFDQRQTNNDGLHLKVRQYVLSGCYRSKP